MAKTLLITPACMMCHQTSEVEVTVAQAAEWADPNRRMIQDIFPELSPAERETIMSGTHPKCWDEMFAGVEE